MTATQAAPKRTSPKRPAPPAATDKRASEEHFEGLAERAWQSRLAWLRRPRVHTAAFEDPPQNVIENPNRIEERTRKRAELAEKLGWPAERLALFGQFVVAYRKEPNVENYVRIRREFPEVEIQIGRFGGIEPLYSLEKGFQRQGVDPDLVAAALDGYESDIDALSLCLAECLVARSKLPSDGPGHLHWQ